MRIRPLQPNFGIDVIGIDTRIEPFENQQQEAIKNWQDIFLADSQPEILAFLQECINQNLILNVIGWTESSTEYDYDTHGTMRYYSIDLQKAKIFIQKLEDMSAKFSLKKFWAQNKFDFTVEWSTVDFDTESTTFEVVNTQRAEIWGFAFPAHNIIKTAG